MISEGGVVPLVSAMSNTSADAREQAAAALAKLAAGNSGAQKAIAAEGGIEPLIRILTVAEAPTGGAVNEVGSGGPQVDTMEGREFASAALAELAHSQEVRGTRRKAVAPSPATRPSSPSPFHASLSLPHSSP